MLVNCLGSGQVYFMTIWPLEKKSLKRPAYRSLAQYIIDAIESGTVESGTKLPTHRALAFDLGLSVQTVSRAYDELHRLGFVSGEVGRGTYVRTAPTDARMPWQRPAQENGTIDCSMLVPVTGQIHTERMSATLADLAVEPPGNAIFSFRPRATFEVHCKEVVTWLAQCGLPTRPDLVLPTNGNTSAMTAALMTCALPGDTIVTEEFGHHTLKSLTNALGLRLAGLALDEHGVLPDALDRACRSGSVKAVFLQPSGLSPSASMMDLSRRQKLVEIARKHDVWIIENDAWGPLHPERPPPIAAIAPERTFYFTGLTKCLLPGLRVAWLVAPERMMAAARTRHLVTSWMATPLMAEIATRWLADGTALELLEWQRKHLGRRNALAVQTLKDIPHGGTSHGMHLWLPLPDAWREDAFVTHAGHNGVAVAAGANFAIEDGKMPPAVRICLGMGTETDIESALSVIARLHRSVPEPALLAL